MLYTLKMTLSGSESPPGHCPGPPVIGAALHWLHSLRLPLLFTIIFHHSDWAGYNPAWFHSLLPVCIAEGVVIISNPFL